MQTPAETHQAYRLTGVVYTALGALGFSFKSIFVKAAYRYGVPAETLLCLRMAYALPFFMLMAWNVQRQEPHSLGRADWLDLLLLGTFGYYLASYLDFLGLKSISAGLERIVLYTYPTMVVVLSALFRHQHLARKKWWLLALSYLGVVVSVAPELRHGASHTLLGLILVLGSALSYAIYLVRCGAAVHRLGATRVTAFATGIACVLCILQFTVLKPLDSLRQPWPVQAYGLAMGVFSTVLPVWFLNAGIRRLGASTAAIVGSIGPILTLLLAAVFLHEPLLASQLAGAAVVIFAVSRLARS